MGQLRYQASSFYNVVLFNNEKALSWDFSAWAYRARAGGAATPPQFVGQTKPVGQVRFTVGQYWLIIKINGTNFVGNSVNFVGNMLSNRNFSLSLLPPSTTSLESFSGKFFLTTRTQSEKVGQILSPPP